MKRKCNLELRLERPSVFLRPTDHDCGHPDMVDKDEGGKQQLTIFYSGKIAVCDATELQARAIISLARDNAEIYEWGRSDVAPALVGSSPSPVYSPTTGLKRSLMRFLHTRKTRVQASSPYRRPPS